MPLSNTFVTPAKGNQPRRKICHAATLTTFGTVTQSLLKRFHETGLSIKAPSISVKSFPDFNTIPLPDDIMPEEKNKIIRQMTITYAANLASDTAKSSMLKISSIHDTKTQCSYDIKLINNVIEDSTDSFLQGLSVVPENSSAVGPVLLIWFSTLL